MRQGIAVRGDTDLKSNIYQFDLDKAINDKGLKLLRQEKRFVSAHDTVEEQMQVLVLTARRDLLSRTLEKDFYTIVADESSDVSKKEQLSFCVRTCKVCHEITEDFDGFMNVSKV